MKIMLKNLSKPLLAALSGMFLTLAFAPFEIFPFAVLAPAGLCALIYHASPRRSFWYGFSFGLGFFGSGVYWVFISISRYGDVPAIIAFAITTLFIAYLSLFPAYTCYLTNQYFNAHMRTKILCAFPAIWVLSEYIRSWFFTGFPWLLLGYSQTNSPLKGYAPIFSVYGVSLAIMVTSSLLVNGVMAFRKHDYYNVYVNLMIATTLWIAGGMLSLIPWTDTTGKPITVSLVQGNIPQSIKWDPDNVALSFNTYRELTDPLWGKSDLVIWPEMAIPVPLQDTPNFVNDLAAKAKSTHTALIFGIPVQTADGQNYYNALLSVGQSEAAYTKRQLVPFGEYVPFQPILARAFDLLNVPMSNLRNGNYRQAPMQIGDLKILPSICYEITYPDLSRSTDPDISLLLTVTNDAWFDRSTAQAQHLQMAAMRSIEMARPGLFVSNDGITAIISSTGLIEKAAPTHTPFVLRGSIEARKGLTPWMRNGIDPILAIALVMLFASLRRVYLSKKQLSTTLISTTKK